MANDINYNVNVNTKPAVKTIDDLDKSINNLDKSVKSTGDATKSLASGFKGVGLAMKAAGIGLMMKAIEVLTDVMKSNKVVANQMAIGFEFLSEIFGQLVTIVTNVYDSVAKASNGFDGLKNVISGLLTVGLYPLKITFYAIKSAILEAQLAWENSMFGDGDTKKIDALNTSINETNASIKEISIGVVDAGVKIAKNFGDAVSEVGAFASGVADGISKIDVAATYASSKIKVARDAAAEGNAAIKAANEKAAAEEKAALEESIKNLKELKDQQTIDTIADESDKQRKLLEIQQKAAQDELDLRISAAKKGSDLEKQLFEERKALIATQLQETAVLEHDILVAENAKKDEEDERRYQTDKEKNDQRMAEAKTAKDKQAADDLAAEQTYQDQKNAIQQTAAQTTIAIFDAISSINALRMNKDLKMAEGDAEKQDAIKKKYFEKDKKMKIARAIMDTIQGAMSAFNSLASIPVVGSILGAIAAAAVGVTGAMNVATIRSTTYESASAGAPAVPDVAAPASGPSKFASGGLVRGPGTGTSDSIPSLLSDGESIINARSTAMFGGLLSDINQAGGGVPIGNSGSVGGSTTIKTYVVASDMSSQQEADFRIQQLAQL